MIVLRFMGRFRVMSRFARYGWAVLAYNLIVILWGAYVRASGSGAGCGAHWPLCNGEVIPRAPSLETLIELTHRATSGIAFLLVVGQLVWARRRFAAGTAVRAVAHVAMALMVTEALVGAGLVLFEYVADDASIARAYWLAAHLLNTFALVAALAVVPWLADGPAQPTFEMRGSEVTLLVVAVLGTMLLGMTGAITALGDTLFPARSLAEGMAQDFSPTAHFLLRLRIIHPTLAVLMAFVLWLAAGVNAMRRPAPTVRRLAVAVAVLVAVQLLAGLVNLLLLAPIWMQLVHLLLADLLWIALILLATAAITTAAITTAAGASAGRAGGMDPHGAR